MGARAVASVWSREPTMAEFTGPFFEVSPAYMAAAEGYRGTSGAILYYVESDAEPVLR